MHIYDESKLIEVKSRMLVTRGWWWVNWGDDGQVAKVSLMQNEWTSLFEVSFILRDPLCTTGSIVNNTVLYTYRFSERKDIKFCYHKKSTEGNFWNGYICSFAMYIRKV